jgi:hypothetical protein
MTSLSRRLQRLEATAARLDPSERRREFEELGDPWGLYSVGIQ